MPGARSGRQGPAYLYSAVRRWHGNAQKRAHGLAKPACAAMRRGPWNKVERTRQNTKKIIENEYTHAQHASRRWVPADPRNKHRIPRGVDGIVNSICSGLGQGGRRPGPLIPLATLLLVPCLLFAPAIDQSERNPADHWLAFCWPSKPIQAVDGNPAGTRVPLHRCKTGAGWLAGPATVEARFLF